MKIRVSAFEYAIRTVAEPETLDQFEPETKQQELKRRKDRLMNQAKRMRIQKQ